MSGHSRRGRSVPMERRKDGRQDQRKDRTLQARIPEQLDRELRERAGRLGLSVSTLVRNALLNTFDLVDGIVADSAHVAHAMRPDDRASRASGPAPTSQATTPVESVLGWQEVILNVNAVCDRCNTVMLEGERGGIGVPTGPRPLFACTSCIAKRAPSGTAGEPAARPQTPLPSQPRRRSR